MSFEPHDYLRHILAEVEYLLDQRRTFTYERNVLGTQMTVLASNTARQSSGITFSRVKQEQALLRIVTTEKKLREREPF